LSLTNIKRWIKASYVEELRKRLIGAKIFVEGGDRLTSIEDKFYEIRIDGPYNTPCGTKGEFCSYIEVNLLANSTRNESDGYERESLEGIMAEALNKDFCIYKIGNVGKNDADDESLVGVMQLIPSDSIKISDFGQIDPNVQVYQSVAEAHYEMYWSAT
jgi:hypothetical protein